MFTELPVWMLQTMGQLGGRGCWILGAASDSCVVPSTAHAALVAVATAGDAEVVADGDEDGADSAGCYGN